MLLFVKGRDNLKRLFALFLLSMTLFAAGCGETPPPVATFNVDEGKQVVTHYLSALVEGNMSAAQGYLTSGLKSKLKITLERLHPLGYSIMSGQDISGGGQYDVKLYEANGDANYVVNDLNITVKKDADGDYIISDLNFLPEAEIKQKGLNLVLVQGKTETTLLSVYDLPVKAAPQEANGKEFAVEKNSFGPVALSPDKRFLLLSSNGPHAFLGKYSFENKNLTPLDMYTGANILQISWSPDGTIYAVEGRKASGGHDILLYDSMSDARYPFPAARLFSDPQFVLSKPFFVDDNFYFSVKTEQRKNKSLSGWWVYNFKTRKIGKLLQ